MLFTDIEMRICYNETMICKILKVCLSQKPMEKVGTKCIQKKQNNHEH